MNTFEMITPSDDVIEQAMGHEDLWYDKGSYLYNSARILVGCDLENLKTRYVGAPDAHDGSSTDYKTASMNQVVDMLTGMAIECWLKGLCIARQPRESGALRNEISALIDLQLRSVDKITEASIEDIYDAMQHEEVQELLISQSELTSSENAKRYELWENLVTHNLLGLYKQLPDYIQLNEIEEMALRYFRQMITLGRYPALKKGQGVIYVNDRRALQNATDQIQKNILEMKDNTGFGDNRLESSGVE